MALRKVTYTAALVLPALIVIIMFFRTQFFRLRVVTDIPVTYSSALDSLAAIALQSNDVPVAAIITYDGEIIGCGYNTVYRDEKPAGHAEINALEDAAKKLGIREFLGLDRDKLMVISTYEPCEMCRGALNHYRISNIRFLKDKTFRMWIRSHRSEWEYEFTKRQVEGEELQDSLFRMHPEYPGR